jgi:hypothetical protein
MLVFNYFYPWCFVWEGNNLMELLIDSKVGQPLQGVRLKRNDISRIIGYEQKVHTIHDSS